MMNLQKNRSIYYVATLILVTSVILLKEINHGEFWFSDASRHAMDGVFVLDFIKDMPLLHMYDYISQYYTKYPALGIGVYPPFFALVEAGFYALFGISVVSARLTVLFFAFIAVIFWFKLIKLIFDERIAFYSSFIFITTPFIVRWSKEVMLEMPTLAMIILSVYFFYNFIEFNKHKHGYYLIFTTVAAIYSKQTAIFILPAFFLYLILTRKFKRLLDKDVIFTCLALFSLLLPLVIFTIEKGNMNLAQSIGNIEEQACLIYFEQWLAYPRFLSKVLSLPVLILSIFSILLIFLKKDNQKLLLFFAWILSFYLIYTYINVKTIRYAYFWLPPFTLLATLILNKVPWKIKKVSISTIFLMLLCIYQFSLSFNLNNSFIYGYEEAAWYILKEEEGGRVFFHGSGIGTGNFIFNIRKLDRDRRMVVFRGDKLLASSAIYPHNLLVEYAKDRNEIHDILKAYGLKYFVIEETSDYNINVYKILRDVLKSDDFTLVKKIKLNTNIHSLRDESILIYRRNKDISQKLNLVHISLPIIGTEITVPLKTLSDFYTPAEVIVR